MLTGKIILGLGSNKGNRHANLASAVSAIGEFASHISCSLIYESRALLPPDAPADWNMDFLNMALSCETSLLPRELLRKIKEIEKYTGRTPSGYWGPREIDIDILAYADVTVNEPDLIIPHPFLLERDFALIPFAEIAPDWIYPGLGKTAYQLSKRLEPTLVKAVPQSFV